MFFFYNLFFLLPFILFLVILGIGSILLRFIFGKSVRYTFHKKQSTNEVKGKRTTFYRKKPNTPRKKLFTADEGEYVEFEEIKEENTKNV